MNQERGEHERGFLVNYGVIKRIFIFFDKHQQISTNKLPGRQRAYAPLSDPSRPRRTQVHTAGDSFHGIIRDAGPHRRLPLHAATSSQTSELGLRIAILRSEEHTSEL